MPTVQEYEDFADEMSALINKQQLWTTEDALRALGYFLNAFFIAQWQDAAVRREELRSWVAWLVFANDRATIIEDRGSTKELRRLN
jgi:hypothetical protein